MKVTIVTFCLIGAVFANPILYNVDVEPNGLETNMTLSLSDSQSSESDTSELQSSEENTSNQSSESESLESTSEDKTSEESDSESDEDTTLTMGETQDNSLGSEENLRKGWIRVFASVVRVLSAEDNSSTEVKGQSDHLGNKQTQASHPSTGTAFRWRASTAQGNTNLTLVESNTDSSDTSDSAGITDATSESSDSTSSESDETSENSDSSRESSRESSESAEESDASDSADLEQVRAKDCAQGADSTDCDSEEYFFQDIGDDAHHPVGHLMVPEEDDRELSLRR
ncbi:secretory calcium-binding phosphoprotein 1 [Centroberyx affinis]|uniref:secretory calcium-binding phosphoprotein 1 n=1 Tax=Centroberyx affinis TaxID=166261 RepID=UPI003A5C5BE8